MTSAGPPVANVDTDGDGCPDRRRVLAMKVPLDVEEEVYFAENRSEVLPVALPLIGFKLLRRTDGFPVQEKN